MASWLQLAALLVAACAVSEVAAQCPAFCSCEGTSMYCVNAELTAPPVGYWISLRHLSLDGNNITELDEDSFEGFPALTKLTLTNNQLTTLDRAPFRSLSSLGSLDLSGNRISEIVSGTSKSLGLKELYLNDNKLTKLDPPNVLNQYVVQYVGLVEMKNNPLKVEPGTTFITDNYLDSIALDGIDASELSRDTFFRSGSYPWILSLQNAGVRDITGAFTGMTRLTTLRLSGNNITHVTAGTFYTGRFLSELYLNDNPLQRVDLAAVNDVLPSSKYVETVLDISDTPLACDCAYENLYWWAKGRTITLTADCRGINACQFGP